MKKIIRISALALVAYLVIKYPTVVATTAAHAVGAVRDTASAVFVKIG